MVEALVGSVRGWSLPLSLRLVSSLTQRACFLNELIGQCDGQDRRAHDCQTHEEDYDSP